MTRADLVRLLRDAGLAWPGITHVRVRPRWIRWSDFTQQPPFIFESEADELA